MNLKPATATRIVRQLLAAYTLKGVKTGAIGAGSRKITLVHLADVEQATPVVERLAREYPKCNVQALTPELVAMTWPA
jgi:hypothetical protein